jgi:hypothetical protein
MKIFHHHHHLKSKLFRLYFLVFFLFNYIFSTESTRPTSPKSDTEYELDKSSEKTTKKNQTSVGWRWKWGELPKYLWPSSSKKQSTPKEGKYLADITNNKCADSSRYLPEM